MSRKEGWREYTTIEDYGDATIQEREEYPPPAKKKKTTTKNVKTADECILLILLSLTIVISLTEKRQ